jgi:hypothetical protein
VLDANEKKDRAVAVGIATVLAGQGSATHRFYAPNDVHIQYNRWDCVENCIQPEYQRIRGVKEKYKSYPLPILLGPSEAGRSGA